MPHSPLTQDFCPLLAASLPRSADKVAFWKCQAQRGLTEHAFLHSAGNQESNFQLSREGKLKVLRDLDREKEPYHSIIVKASSQRNWAPPRGQRAARTQFWDLSEDLTLQEVRIFLDDINDQSPQFTKSEYTAGKRCQGLGGHQEPEILPGKSSRMMGQREPAWPQVPFPSLPQRGCHRCQGGVGADQSARSGRRRGQ